MQKWLSSPEITKSAGAGPALPAARGTEGSGELGAEHRHGWGRWQGLAGLGTSLEEPAVCYHLLEAGKEGELLWERVCALKNPTGRVCALHI